MAGVTRNPVCFCYQPTRPWNGGNERHPKDGNVALADGAVQASAVQLSAPRWFKPALPPTASRCHKHPDHELATRPPRSRCWNSWWSRSPSSARVLVLLPIVGNARARPHRISCTNNLKQLNFAFRIWANAHDDKFLQVPATNGGARRMGSSGAAHAVFLTMSNELKAQSPDLSVRLKPGGRHHFFSNRSTRQSG